MERRNIIRIIPKKRQTRKIFYQTVTLQQKRKINPAPVKVKRKKEKHVNKTEKYDTGTGQTEIPTSENNSSYTSSDSSSSSQSISNQIYFYNPIFFYFNQPYKKHDGFLNYHQFIPNLPNINIMSNPMVQTLIKNVLQALLGFNSIPYRPSINKTLYRHRQLFTGNR